MILKRQERIKCLMSDSKMKTFSCRANTICGKLANWNKMKKMSWLDKCCHSKWCDSPFSVFSIATIMSSTTRPSKASHLWRC